MGEKRKNGKKYKRIDKSVRTVLQKFDTIR